MFRKIKKISYRKSGSGSLTPSITIPITWLRTMGVDENNRNVEVSFEDNKIIIKKL